MKKTVILCLVALLLTACEEALLGTEEVNTPEHNFDLLWQDFDQHYSLFYIKNTNWDALYDEYRPLVDENTTPKRLWEIMTSMLEVLNDSHTALYFENDRSSFASGYTLNEIAIKEEFNLGLIKNKYTDPLTRIESEEDLLYGKVKNKDIGYIFLRKTDGQNPEAAMDEVISALNTHKAIILDLRTNAGGYAYYSKIIAGAFSDGEHFIGTVQVRNGPNHGDFDEKTNEVTTKTGAEQFLKPVIVLTDRATMSGGEYLTLHMRSFGQVTHIGDTTAGDLGATGLRRFLPNGWSYTYSIKMFLTPDGKTLDGIGIVPQVYVKNTNADIGSGHDKVMEKAIEYLFETYGIE
jgi:carboxyl-terminal processing protease